MEKTDISLEALAPFVRRAGIQGGAQWQNRTRRIYDHQWMFCTSGRAYYQAEGVTHELTAGTLLLIEPDIPHAFWMEEGNHATIKWIHFDLEYRKDVYDIDQLVCNDRSGYFDDSLPMKRLIRQSYRFEGRFELPTIMQIEDTTTVDNAFSEILSCYKQHKLTWQLAAKANFMLIFKSVIEQMLDDKSLSTQPDKSDLIKEICNYINSNYHNKLTRQNLANYFGYNEDYIGKVFKKEMNQTISVYINKLRIDKARGLLAHTDLSVQNISELVGFSDVFYFSKKMKALTGNTPTDWR